MFTANDRPDLWDKAESSFPVLWPEYNLHGDVAGEYFSALFPQHAHVQVLVYDTERERVVARGRAIPFRWNKTLEDLPTGIDAVGMRALEAGSTPTTLSALAVEVVPEERNRGLAGLTLQALAQAARAARLAPLVAPVRPSRKEQYPLIPIVQYCKWRRDDGLPFDPWMRIHVRLGGSVVRPEPRSMRITGTVQEWQEWTQMPFPDDGTYVFPGGLAPLTVTNGVGRYWEPNVWMLHKVG